MTTNLILEYTCTPQEMSEAQSLSIRHQLGGGSKWRTWLVLSAALAFVLVLLYFEIQREVPPLYRPYAFTGFILFVPAVLYIQRRRRKAPRGVARLELTDRELTILTDNGHVSMPWESFSECFESSNLFALVDRPKGFLIVLPKRAFPDEQAQAWFRTCANRRQTAADSPSTTEMPLSTVPESADAIHLNLRLGYLDYLNRTTASWRTRAIIIAIFSIILGLFFYTIAHPNPHAVNSPAKVFLLMLPIFPITATMCVFLFSINGWTSHKGYLINQQWLLTGETMLCSSAQEKAAIPWTTYTSYLENRWSFILWSSQTGAWMLFPKRAFSSPAEIQKCRTLLKTRLQHPLGFGFESKNSSELKLH